MKTLASLVNVDAGVANVAVDDVVLVQVTKSLQNAVGILPNLAVLGRDPSFDVPGSGSAREITLQIQKKFRNSTSDKQE